MKVRSVCLCGLPAAVVLVALLGIVADAHAGLLNAMREDVRTGVSSAPDSSGHDSDDDSSGSILGDICFGILGAIFSGSSSDCHDSQSSTTTIEYTQPDVEYYFPSYPYDDVPGYMTSSTGPSTRRWSARLRADYADDLDNVHRIGGHLLLSTTSGWGLDTAMDFLEEDLPGHTHDQLWVGDCNVVYRLVETEHCQWRTGIGFNWLDDPIDTDFGFNFTLGTDFYPVRPWIVSATLDWGTIGHAELFHFRTTLGAMVQRVETYVGYEYYDLDRTQINSLIAGVRLWF